MAEALKPNRLASNPHGKVKFDRMSVRVMLPPTIMDTNAALAEGFFVKIKARTGTNKPDTINA